MTTEINPFRSIVLSAAAVVFACFSLLNSGVQAADFLWTGNAGSGNFQYGTAANWVGGVAPAFDWAPVPVFGSDVVNGTVDMGVSYVAGSVVVASGATQDITFNGPGELILGLTGGTGDATIHLAATGKNLTFNSPVGTAWSAIIWDIGAGRTLTINGGLCGNTWVPGTPCDIVKNGGGTTVLASAVTNIGATTVNGGTLHMPEGSWVLNGIAHYPITVNAGATLTTSSGASEYAVGPTLNGGTINSRGLDMPGRGNWGNILLDPGAQVTAGGAAVSTIASQVSMSGTNVFAVDASSTLNLTGPVVDSPWGTAGLTKTGAGTLNLTGPNDYTGPTTIDGGMIWANYDAGSRIGSGPVTVGGNDSPNTSSFTIWANLGATLANNFVLNSMGSAQNRGAINQDGGAGLVILNGSITLAGDSRIGTGGSSWNSMVINGQISGPGKLYVWENTNTTFNVTQLTLNNGANNYSGGTVIEHGHLSITQGTPLGTGPVTVNSGAILALGSGTVTVGSLTLDANATLDLTRPLTAAADSVLQVNGNLVLGGNLAAGDASPGKVYAIHYTGALTNLGFTTSVIVAGKTVLVDTVSTPGQVLFNVGMLNPAAGQNVPMDLAAPLSLGWVPLLGATAYDVYLGTGSGAVAAATTTTAGIYQSRTNGMTMNIASLQPNTTYYWRVDGVAANGTPTTGTVHSFTTGAAMVDLMEDTWVATDALGRKLPGLAESGSPRTNRPIAMFYNLFKGGGAGGYGDFWTGRTNWDISKILAEHPYTDPHNPWADNPVFQQNQQVYWWWGEPELGYYTDGDAWMLRRQITLLNHAGVDVLVFNIQTGATYDAARDALCDVIRQMRLEGQKINLKIAFNTVDPATPTYMYDTFYSQNKYSDLWYYWQGKPLMLSSSDGSSSKIQNFFTWRYTWANLEANQLHDGWQWIDLPTPQNWGYDTRQDLPESVPVSCGGWVGDGRSKSNNVMADYDNHHLPIQRTSDQGIFFKEQINYGLKYDPQLLFITQWNEWIAASWPAPYDGWPTVLGNPCPKDGFYFVDCYNQEHSRDIEPMKGGYTDNYYFQMIGQNRLRKGVRPVPVASAPQTINLTGGFSQWDNVAPAYYDAVKDTIWRNSPSADERLGNYTNTTGRNDLTVMKMARDADNFYFYARCNSNITSYTDSNWMVLLIDSDQNHATGWEGYDYSVNLGARTATTTTLSQNPSTTNGWTWTPVRSDIAYTVSGNQLMLTIPRASLRLGADPAQFDFHWADNFQTTDIADFGVNGDSAPDRRFNYRYNATTNTEVTLLADDFESGKQSAWAETWTNGSRWDLTTASPYTGSTCAVGRSAASGQSDLIARASTAGYGSIRLNFHYKLADVRNAQTLQISYLTADGWVPIKQLSRDEFYPVNQAWSYDEQQNVWLNFTDARYNTGPDARFFTTDFAFRIDASALTGEGQQVFVDAVNLTANTQMPAAVSPQTWQTQDIGNAGNMGSVATNGGSFTVAGTGMDIGNNGDAFRFLYQTRNGDGTLTARVTGITPTDPWAKAGVMIRESLDVGARNAMMALSAENGVAFQQRTVSLGASTSTVVGPKVAPPYWLRVVRAGNAFTGYVSTDGSSWTQIGTTNIAGFNSTALWGLAVTAHNNTLTNAATFDNVQTPTVAYYWDNNGDTNGFGSAEGTWAGTTIGDSSHGWSTEPTGGTIPGTVTTATSDDSANFGTDSSGLAAGTITVANTVNAGSNLFFGAVSGAITVSGGTSITLPATATITVNNTSDVISTPLGGASTSLTKTGAGTLTLTGANTYSGATVVNAGTLQIGDGTSGHDGSLLSNGITDSGALVYNLYGNQTAGYAISGTGSLTKNGAGTLTLTGPNTYTGATTISAGTLEVGGTGTLGGGTYAGTITNNGAFVHSSSADQTLAAISGNGSITQSGASTLTITGWGVGNGGDITVNSGTLEMPDGNWNQESHNIVVNGGTFSTSDGNSRALSWTLNGGTVSSRGDASPTFWGNVMLYDSQAVTVGGAAVSTISSHVMLGAGSEFAVGAGSTLNVTGALSNSVWATGGNGSFIKSGDGTLALSSANNYTGTTTVNGGTLNIDGFISSSASISIAAGATLNAAGYDTLSSGNWTIAGILNKTDNAIQDITNRVTLNNGTISGATDNATWGTYNMWGGAITANGSANTINAARLGMSSGLTIATPNAGDALSVSSILGATNASGGGLTKTGLGTLTLTGANTYTGATTINGGTLAIGASNVLPNGTNVTLGTATLNAATFTDTAGTLAISGGGTINLGSGAALAFADSHSVAWTGTLTLTGTYVSGFSLRFGTDATGLTSGQLASISKPGGGAVALDASGFLVDAVAGYASWKAVNAPTGTTADDYDGDGVSNGVEFGIGGTKDSNDLSKQPAVSTSGTNLLFTFQRAQASIDGTTAVAIQVGSELNTWSDSYNVPGTAQANNPGVTVVKDTSLGFDTVTLTVPRAPDAKKFARLVVTPAP